MVDVQLAEATFKAWSGQNENKELWDKDPMLCKIVRHGLPVDNIISIASARESRRMRRLVGPPFAKKFLVDQENVLKECVKNVISNVESLRINDGKVDMMHEYKKYTLDVLSIFFGVNILTVLAEFVFGGCFRGDLIQSSVNKFQLMDDALLCSVVRTLIYLIGRYSRLYFRWCLSYVMRYHGGNWRGHVHETNLERYSIFGIYLTKCKICELSVKEYNSKVKPVSRKDSLGQLIASRDADGSNLSHDELIAATYILMFAGQTPKSFVLLI